MTETESAAKGGGSFCIPRSAVAALLEARADTATIGAYLTLACFTDESGMYSSASAHAVRKYLSVNLARATRALGKLQDIRAKVGSKSTPLVYSRDAWTKQTRQPLPDGPVARARVMHVLPIFEEDLSERVWFSTNIVVGFEGFTLPLKHLKNAGDIATRLLLIAYQAIEMDTYGGVNPHTGPWKRYETVTDEKLYGWRLIHGADQGAVGRTSDVQATTGGTTSEHWTQYFSALSALERAGFFYESVVVMNRDPQQATFSSGKNYGAIPQDADPLYQLYTRNKHGAAPAGEEGLAGLTAKTAGQVSLPVADHEGTFDGRFAAIVPEGYGAMIAGIYRPRFRPSNPKNASVKATWAAIRTNDRTGLEWINGLRKVYGLPYLEVPTKPEAGTLEKPTERAEGVVA